MTTTGRMRNLMLAAWIAGLGASPALAANRSPRLYTGHHAQVMNRLYQASQQHNAVINQVQQNIYNEQRTRY